MLDQITSKRFDKNLRKCAKRGYNIERLSSIVEKLRLGQPLWPSCHPHRIESWGPGVWECHIEQNWLLVYRIEQGILYLDNTGTHDELGL